MTNTAITAAILLIFAIPGYFARLFYFSGELTRAILPRKLLDDLAISIIFAIAIHIGCNPTKGRKVA